MANIPATSTTLLRNIAQDSQHSRWTEFVARYRPMMEAYLRGRFPSLEADDIIQETLAALCQALPDYKYDPAEKGFFHNYLTGILRNKAVGALRKRTGESEKMAEYANHAALRTPGMMQPEDEDGRSWRDAVFEIALRRFLADETVADRTKRIFERTAIGGESPESVAAAFKMTRHAVDQAKSRAMARLREIVRKLEAAGDA